MARLYEIVDNEFYVCYNATQGEMTMIKMWKRCNTAEGVLGEETNDHLSAGFLLAENDKDVVDYNAKVSQERFHIVEPGAYYFDDDWCAWQSIDAEVLLLSMRLDILQGLQREMRGIEVKDEE